MDYMAKALALARQALGTTSPNPAVGAVVVKDGKVVGKGHTQPPGSWHAEVMALSEAGEVARGATLYVTLEPCCHHGRTPPCTQAIIAASIAEVHLATLDPNPRVCGQGRQELEVAGIRTVVGDREEEAQELNEAYLKYITTGLPFVATKFAMSLDGKIATHKGHARWISGEEARGFAHRLRAQVDVMVVGVGNVLADDPELTARPDGVAQERQPLRVIVDSRGRTPCSAKAFQAPGRAVIATTEAIGSTKARCLEEAGAEVLVLPSKDGRVDLAALVEVLGQRQQTSVLVEGGGVLLASFIEEGLVDKVYAVVAPLIIGGQGAPSPVAGRGIGHMAEALRLDRIRVERLGEDVLIQGYLPKGAGHVHRHS